MSAAGLLEIPAFMVGLSGLTDLVVRGISLWQLIAGSEYFGEDLVRSMCKLHFEYALFHAWCEGIGISPNRAGASSLLRVPPRTQSLRPSIFPEELRAQSHSPFHIAVSRIVDILESIEAITASLRSRASEHSVAHGAVGAVTGGVLAIGLGPAATPVASHGRRALREWAYNRISMIRRVQLQLSITSTSSERGQLDLLIREFRDLNRDLWDFLQAGRRDEIITRFLPVTVFDIPYDRHGLGSLQEAAREDFPSISNSANLWIGRVEIESVSVKDSISFPIPISHLKLSVAHDGPWQLATWTEDAPESSSKASTRPVLVESYEYKRLSEDQIEVTTSRLNKLSLITRLSPAVSDLRILTSPGYLRWTDANRTMFGLVFEIPIAADPTKAPVSLASLFLKDRFGGYPSELSLRQKFILANQLATCLAAFHRVHWYHGSFDADSVLFFYSLADRSALLLSSPYIVGFGFSRPGDTTSLYLNPTWDMHTHPELRYGVPYVPPQFQRRHDIYSLGVLLFNIGIWGTAAEHFYSAGGNVTTESFRSLLEENAVGLRGRMGNEYMLMTRWCLRLPEEGAFDRHDVPQITLETFYWRVLYVLGRCHSYEVEEEDVSKG